MPSIRLDSTMKLWACARFTGHPLSHVLPAWRSLSRGPDSSGRVIQCVGRAAGVQSELARARARRVVGGVTGAGPGLDAYFRLLLWRVRVERDHAVAFVARVGAALRVVILAHAVLGPIGLAVAHPQVADRLRRRERREVLEPVERDSALRRRCFWRVLASPGRVAQLRAVAAADLMALSGERGVDLGDVGAVTLEVASHRRQHLADLAVIVGVPM